MPDYIYLLENRLSADQKNALRYLREVARDAETILFLTGDAVRDLTSGHAVRDIEVAILGNALDLKKALKDTPAQILMNRTWIDHGLPGLRILDPMRADHIHAHGARKTQIERP